MHRGVEVEARARIARTVEVAGHLTFAEDEHRAFVENVFDESGELVAVDRAGKRVAGFPERLGRLALVWTPTWGRVEVGALHTGRIFVDNSETRERSVDPSTVAHLDLSVPLQRWSGWPIEARVRVNNVFDTEYESFGYFWGVEPTFLPAAGTHAFVTLAYNP
ncbi:MAG: TonB-dependent receptor [Acidobacteria bacterium]|nr:TonB-dependent receptor [Acidobacteriota bacterium]